MDSANYVTLTSFGTYVVVINGQIVAEFLDQWSAENTYNLYRGGGTTVPVAIRPEDQNPPMMAPCGHGEPAPVVGGYWACVAGYWQPTTQSDPRAQANPPRPPAGTAPVSPESSLPPASSAPAGGSPVTLDSLAGRFGTSRGGLLVAGGIVAAAWLLR